MLFLRTLLLVNCLGFFISCTGVVEKSKIPALKTEFSNLDETYLINGFTENIENNIDVAQNYYKRAKLLLKQNKIEAALADIEKAENLQPNAAKIYYVKALILKDIGKGQALEAANNAEALGMIVPDLFLLKAQLYSQKNDLDKAKENLDKAESLYPNYHTLYQEKGNYSLLLGDTLSGIQNYQKAIGIREDFYEPYQSLLDIYTRRKNNTEVLTVFEKAINGFPDRTELLLSKARLLENLKLVDSAKVVYRQYLDQEPQRIDITTYLGNLFFKNKNYKEAYIEYKKVIDSLPETRGVYYLAAISKEKTAEYNEAKILYSKALEQNLENREIQKAIRRMDYYINRRVFYKVEPPKINIRAEEPAPVVRKKFPALDAIEPKEIK